MYKRIPMPKAVKSLVIKAFDSTEPRFARKRDMVLSTFPEAGMKVSSYWDGGTKSYWAICDLTTGKIHQVESNHPFFEPGHPEYLPHLPENFVLLRCGFFCGKVIPPQVYVNSENLPKWLEA